MDVAGWLMAAGAWVVAHDPMVTSVPGLAELEIAPTPYQAARRADAVVVLTDWPEYLGLDLARLRRQMRGDVLIDGRNMLDPTSCLGAGFRYEGVGRFVPRAAQRLDRDTVVSLLPHRSRPRRPRSILALPEKRRSSR
ncbi:MAG: hypothetical protein NVSMB32_19120 [Actinomycetota bacterium]